MICSLIPNRLKMLFVALVAAILLLLGGYLAGLKDGVIRVETRMERKNNEAVSRALDAAHSYNECLDAGGVWVFRTGKCTRRPGSARN